MILCTGLQQEQSRSVILIILRPNVCTMMVSAEPGELRGAPSMESEAGFQEPQVPVSNLSWIRIGSDSVN